MSADDRILGDFSDHRRSLKAATRLTTAAIEMSAIVVAAEQEMELRQAIKAVESLAGPQPPEVLALVDAAKAALRPFVHAVARRERDYWRAEPEK